MDRHTFLAETGAMLLAAPLAAEAKEPGKGPRVGFLGPRTRADAAPYLDAFLLGLREIGWVEAKNIFIEYRWAEGRPERLPDLAAELVRLKVDVILAGPTSAAVAAKNATSTIPIVTTSAGDPGVGLVASLAHPGGNVTGLSFSVAMATIGKGLELLRETVPKVRRVAVLSNPASPAHALAIKEVAARSVGVQVQLLEAQGPTELDSAFAAMARERAGGRIVTRQLQLLREAVPNASRVAVLSNPANAYTALMIKETEAAARSLGVRVRILGVRGADALGSVFSAVTKEHPDALFVLLDPVLFGHRTRITEFANKTRLPTVYPHRENRTFATIPGARPPMHRVACPWCRNSASSQCHSSLLATTD